MSDDEQYDDKDDHLDDEDDEDGDYEEEDDEDESDGDAPERPSKKKKSSQSSSSKSRRGKRASGFFEDEAEVGDEDEEYEGEAEGDYSADMLRQQDEIMAANRANRRQYDVKRDTRTEEEIARDWERRAEQYDDDEIEEEEDLFDDVGLPNQNYWRLKCKPGEERSFVASMMQKCINQQNTPDKILIKSVLAPHHLPGHVYIEAEREMHVKHAIKGMYQIIHSGTIMIPLKDMIEILNTTRRSTDLPRGSWVRVRLGKYKDDIGQILDYDAERGRCTVKLIPRIDLSKDDSKDKDKDKESAAATTGTKGKRKSNVRPPQRFFNVKDLTQMGFQILKKKIMGETYSIFNNERYKNGFIYKVMRIKSVVSDGVQPSLEELQKFQDRKDNEDYEEDEDDEDNISGNGNSNGFGILDPSVIPKLSTRTVSFSKGDTVKVIEGDLKGLMGTVDSVDDKSVTVIPIHDDLKDLLVFPPTELQKYFKIGNHVKVIAGRYEGETGLIVRIEDMTAYIISDLTMGEIKVRQHDLQECTEIATGKLELGNYELHDLVQYGPQKVGIIIKVERDSFKILDENSNVSNVKLQEVLNKRRTRNATTMDTNSNTLAANDVVEILDGQYRGKQGSILHISRNFLFLKSKDVFENGGIFVVRANYSSLLGGNKNKQQQPMYNNNGNSNGSGERGGRGGFGGGRGRGGFGGRGREDSPLHKTVSIKCGMWKGYVGIVRECTDIMVQVELQTNSKRINVKRTDILLPGERSQDQWDQQQQQLYSASRTPMREENPGMTPMRMNMTPSRSSSHDPWGGATPSRPSSSSSSSWYSQDEMGSSSQSNSSSSHNDWATPQTSYSSYSPFTPSTPGSEMHNRRHNDSDYTPINIPTPQTYETPTPSSSYHMSSFDQPTPSDNVPPSPFTPHAPQTPATPSTPSMGDDQDDEIDNSPWQGVGFIVVFKSGSNNGETGVVRSNIDSLCSVELVSSGKTINRVNQSDLELAIPAKKERVLIVRGPQALQTGSIFVITNNPAGHNISSAVVRMDHNLDFKVLKMHCLGKLFDQSAPNSE